MAEKEIKRVITITAPTASKTIAELRADIAGYKSAIQDVDITSEEFRVTSEQLTAAQTLLRNAVRGNTAAVEGSYNAYSAQMSLLKQHRKTLAEGTAEYKQATAEIMRLDEKLKQMDAEVGVYGRNVGNYSSAFNGLNASVAQVARELPSLTQGAEMFFRAISNNLPILADNIKAYKELAKTQQGLPGISGALVKSLLSWNTVLTIGITLLVAYGDDILAWAKKMLGAEKQIDATTRAQQALNEELSKGNLGVGDSMVKLQQLSREWVSLGDNLQAKEKFVRDNADAFNKLGVKVDGVNEAESLLVGDTDKFVKAMAARARATAALSLASEKYEEIIKLQMEREAVPEKTTVRREDRNAQPIGYIGEMNTPVYPTVMVEVDNPEYTALSKQIEDAEAEIKVFLSIDEESQKEYTDILESMGLEPTENDKDSNNNKKEIAITFKPEPIGSAEIDAIIAEMMKGREISYDWDTRGLDKVGSTGETNKELQATLQARLEMLDLNAEQRAEIEERLNARIRAIRLQTLEDEEVRLEDQLADLDLNAEQRAGIEDMITQNLIEQADIRLSIIDEENKKRKKAIEEEMALEKLREKNRETALRHTADIFGNMSDLMEEGTAAQKGFAAAQVVIDTYASATSAYKSLSGIPYVGPVLGALAATAAITSGLANLKSILDTEVDGSNAESVASSAQIPKINQPMPASYTRNLISAQEMDELNKDTRVYVVESDITEAQEATRARVESASF